MNEEKRKIGEYTVLCSVNVGEKEVILASNEQSTNGDKYMCGFAERNDLFELCSECMVSDSLVVIAAGCNDTHNPFRRSKIASEDVYDLFGILQL